MKRVTGIGGIFFHAKDPVSTLKKLLAFGVGATLSLTTAAAPVSLPEGPVYLKINGNQQIAVNGASTWFPNEISWGVFVVTNIFKGAVGTEHDRINAHTGTAAAVFIDGLTNNGQITGMFYGVQAGIENAGNHYPATGGFIDLYWRDVDIYGPTDNSATLPTVRRGFDRAQGYTEGIFLARLIFASGSDWSDSNNSISSSVIPAAGGFEGTATWYAVVDTSAPGLWTKQLHTNWFITPFSDTRDMRFMKRYSDNPNWRGGAEVLGATFDDPAQAVVLPRLETVKIANSGKALELHSNFASSRLAWAIASGSSSYALRFNLMKIPHPARRIPAEMSTAEACGSNSGVSCNALKVPTKPSMDRATTTTTRKRDR